MTELSEEVRHELEKLYEDSVPSNAATLLQMVESQGGTTTLWRSRMRKQVAEGKWKRGKRAGDQSYWYWPVEGREV